MADNYQIPHSTWRLYDCTCLVWNFIHEKWFMSCFFFFFQGKTPEHFFKIPCRNHASLQHLNLRKLVILEPLWCRSIGVRLTVVSSGPVVLAAPQLVHGDASWQVAPSGLDLFNPAAQPSDRNMCAGNGCHMTWGLVDATAREQMKTPTHIPQTVIKIQTIFFLNNKTNLKNSRHHNSSFRRFKEQEFKNIDTNQNWWCLPLICPWLYAQPGFADG